MQSQVEDPWPFEAEDAVGAAVWLRARSPSRAWRFTPLTFASADSFFLVLNSDRVIVVLFTSLFIGMIDLYLVDLGYSVHYCVYST